MDGRGEQREKYASKVEGAERDALGRPYVPVGRSSRHSSNEEQPTDDSHPSAEESALLGIVRVTVSLLAGLVVTRGRGLSAAIVGVATLGLVRAFSTVVSFRLIRTSARVVAAVRLSSGLGIVMRRSRGRRGGRSRLRACAPMCECGAGGRQ